MSDGDRKPPRGRASPEASSDVAPHRPGAGRPGAAGVAAGDVRVWIVFHGADVRAAARRLHLGPLPEGVCRVPLG